MTPFVIRATAGIQAGSPLSRRDDNRGSFGVNRRTCSASGPDPASAVSTRGGLPTFAPPHAATGGVVKCAAIPSVYRAVASQIALRGGLKLAAGQMKRAGET